MSPYSLLCQPRRLANYDECLSAQDVWCAVGSWDNSTGICDLQERLPGNISKAAGTNRAQQWVERCVRSTQALEALPDGQRGRVGIIESMTANYVGENGLPKKEEIRRTTQTIRCWAQRHGYRLILHSVSAAELRSGYSAPYGPRRLWKGVPYDKINDVRHRVVARYLHNASTNVEYVLHLDADTLALNTSRSLEPFLSSDAPAMQFQVRENGEVAAATYIARRSAHALCFLSLWDELGHATHRNAVAMPNTDNGVLMMALARLLDEPAALKCEAAALPPPPRFTPQVRSASHSRPAAVMPSAQQPPRAGYPSSADSSVDDDAALSEHQQQDGSTRRRKGHAAAAVSAPDPWTAYTRCFTSLITPSLLRHARVPRHASNSKQHADRQPSRIFSSWMQPSRHREVPWLGVLFPRAGWQRSFEEPNPLVQHHALTSLEPTADVLGHGWKRMGRLLVSSSAREPCRPLSWSSVATRTLDGPSERALTVQMCWWLHPAYGHAAYDSCGRVSDDRQHVLLHYRVVHGPATTKDEKLNISATDAVRIFGRLPRRRLHGAAGSGRHAPTSAT